MSYDDVFTAADGHQHNWDMRCTPVGPTTCMAETVHGDDNHLAGFHFMHEVPQGGPRCVGGVNVDRDIPERTAFWTMTGTLAGGDLTLNPSILCRGGGTPGHGPDFHGFVRDGAWVSA